MSEKSTALNIIQKKQQLNNPTLINRVTFAVFYSLFVCLFKQYSHFANGCCRLTVYFGNRLQFEITGRISLAEAYKVRDRVVHDIAEFTCGVAFRPFLPVPADIKVIFINGSGQIFLLCRSITEAGYFHILTHVNHQGSQNIGFPYSFLLAVNSCCCIQSSTGMSLRDTLIVLSINGSA